MLFIQYPKCSTCKKARAWLVEHGVPFEDRHIVEQNPTAEELADWHGRSGLPLKRFFNTSGLLYKSMNLKDRLPDMPEAEQLRLTAAQNATAAYVAKLKELYQHELDYMNSLSQLTPSAPLTWSSSRPPTRGKGREPVVRQSTTMISSGLGPSATETSIAS